MNSLTMKFTATGTKASPKYYSISESDLLTLSKTSISLARQGRISSSCITEDCTWLNISDVEGVYSRAIIEIPNVLVN